jgi:SWIM zinc finger
MGVAWTPEQVTALAPDASAAKAGKDLAAPRKWGVLGRAEGVIWGECQGSGAKPYQTQVELSGPAFHCTCPSRKFPCKHGIGLLLLHAGGEPAVKEAEAPTWVSA